MSKRKNKKSNKNGDKAIIDLTRFISPETAKFDPDGSYTGVPNEVFYNRFIRYVRRSRTGRRRFIKSKHNKKEVPKGHLFCYIILLF